MPRATDYTFRTAYLTTGNHPEDSRQGVFFRMQLLFHTSDLETAVKLGDKRLQWLREIGAAELSQSTCKERGFLFCYDRGENTYRDRIANHPLVMERPESIGELLSLDKVLSHLQQKSIAIQTPQTWVVNLDEPLPKDLSYPVFVRTAKSSWKRGGRQSRVENEQQLIEEMELLRQAFDWDATILIRQWLDLAIVGEWRYGEVPREIRVWVVDGVPVAWSFHYLGAVTNPKGLSLGDADRQLLRREAKKIASPFSARLLAIDFVQTKQNDWFFLELAPGAMAGTAHESVFKFVAKSLRGDSTICPSNDVGGPL